MNIEKFIILFRNELKIFKINYSENFKLFN